MVPVNRRSVSKIVRFLLQCATLASETGCKKLLLHLTQPSFHLGGRRPLRIASLGGSPLCPELGRSPHVQQGCMPLIGCCNVHGPGGSFFLVPTCARNSLLPRRPSQVGGGRLNTHASAQTEKTHICLLATLLPVVNPTWHTRSLHVTRTSMIALITAPICNYESTTAPVLEDD